MLLGGDKLPFIFLLCIWIDPSLQKEDLAAKLAKEKSKNEEYVR